MPRNRPRPLAPTVLAVAAVLAAASWLASSCAPSHPQRRPDCGRVPHACGFPATTTTGVPQGTVLRPVPGEVTSGPGWHYDPRGWAVVDGPGAVVRGLFFHCTVTVTGSGATLAADRVEASGNRFGVSVRHARNVTVEDTAIYSPFAGSMRLMAGVKDIYGDSAGLRVLRDNIWHTGTGVQVEQGLVEGNFIHAMGYRRGDHVNGITSNGGVTAPLVIRHNTVLVDRGQTDAVGLFEDFGVQANRVVEGNLLAGGGYAVYAGASKGKPAPRNITVTGNVISRLYFPLGGRYGAVTGLRRPAPSR